MMSIKRLNVQHIIFFSFSFLITTDMENKFSRCENLYYAFSSNMISFFNEIDV